MENPKEKMANVLQLLRIAERAFIHKLKKKHPDITETEIEAALQAWYLHRPGAELGDGDGVPGDIGRFLTTNIASKD